MSIQPDQITLRKLVFIKQIYQQALIHTTNQYSDVLKTLSVIEFDFAIETCLKTVYNSLETSRVAPEKFPELIQQCDNLLSNKGMNQIPDKTNILLVHSIRNDAQHKVKYPSIINVNDCRTYTRDFLIKTITDVYGLSFENISLIDEIKHAKIQCYLKAADDALKNNDYQKTIRESASGLVWALTYVQRALVGSEPQFCSAILVHDSFGRVKEDRDVFRAFERMQETLLYVALGMDYSEYMEYKKIVGDTTLVLDGNVHFHGLKGSLTEKDAEFVLNYCIKTIMQIENIVGDLEKPFGKDHWY